MTHRNVLLPLLLLGTATRAAVPTVAVMPFRDLSGQAGQIGEAIRETVTSDLKEVPGLRVIERGQIERVIVEQDLQAQRLELSAIAAVRVGTLLGASMIVVGAYQREEARVRLTARFVAVETGEVVGSAKSDGLASELLSVQDRMTVALLKSIKLDTHARRFEGRSRPRLRSLKTVELYDRAVAEPDVAKKKEWLEASIAEDPAFGYAARDLDELTRHLAELDVSSERASREQVEALRQQIREERAPAQLLEKYSVLFQQLKAHRRYRRLRSEALAAVDRGIPPLAEVALQSQIDADVHLFDSEQVLTDGELFLRRFPTSSSYAAIRELVDDALQRRRHCLEGQGKLDAGVSAAGTDACKVADAHDSACQYALARQSYLTCVAGREHEYKAAVPLMRLIWMDIHVGDWKGAEKALREVEKSGSNMGASMQTALEDQGAYPFPVDD